MMNAIYHNMLFYIFVFSVNGSGRKRTNEVANGLPQSKVRRIDVSEFVTLTQDVQMRCTQSIAGKIRNISATTKETEQNSTVANPDTNRRNIFSNESQVTVKTYRESRMLYLPFQCRFRSDLYNPGNKLAQDIENDTQKQKRRKLENDPRYKDNSQKTLRGYFGLLYGLSVYPPEQNNVEEYGTASNSLNDRSLTVSDFDRRLQAMHRSDTTPETMLASLKEFCLDYEALYVPKKAWTETRNFLHFFEQFRFEDKNDLFTIIMFILDDCFTVSKLKNIKGDELNTICLGSTEITNIYVISKHPFRTRQIGNQLNLNRTKSGIDSKAVYAYSSSIEQIDQASSADSIIRAYARFLLFTILEKHAVDNVFVISPKFHGLQSLLPELHLYLSYRLQSVYDDVKIDDLRREISLEITQLSSIFSLYDYAINSTDVASRNLLLDAISAFRQSIVKAETNANRFGIHLGLYKLAVETLTRTDSAEKNLIPANLLFILAFVINLPIANALASQITLIFESISTLDEFTTTFSQEILCNKTYKRELYVALHLTFQYLKRLYRKDDKQFAIETYVFVVTVNDVMLIELPEETNLIRFSTIDDNDFLNMISYAYEQLHQE